MPPPAQPPPVTPPTESVRHANKRALEGMMATHAQEAAALGTNAMQDMVPILQAARAELNTDLAAWLAQGKGDDRYTPQAYRQSMLAMDATLTHIQQQLGGGMLGMLSNHDAIARAMANSHMAQELLAHMQAGGVGLMPTVPLKVAHALAHGQHAPMERYATSAARYAGQVGKDIRRQLAIGVVRGENLSQLTDRLMNHGGPTGVVALRGIAGQPGSVTEVIPEGLFRRYEYWAERLARTELAHAYNEQVQDIRNELVEDDFPDMVRQWDASVDGRTCPQCAAMHGQTSDPKTDKFTGDVDVPLHPNCRCRAGLWRHEWGKYTEHGYKPPEEPVPQERRADPTMDVLRKDEAQAAIQGMQGKREEAQASQAKAVAAAEARAAAAEAKREAMTAAKTAVVEASTGSTAAASAARYVEGMAQAAAAAAESAMEAAAAAQAMAVAQAKAAEQLAAAQAAKEIAKAKAAEKRAAKKAAEAQAKADAAAKAAEEAKAVELAAHQHTAAMMTAAVQSHVTGAVGAADMAKAATSITDPAVVVYLEDHLGVIKEHVAQAGAALSELQSFLAEHPAAMDPDAVSTLAAAVEHAKSLVDVVHEQAAKAAESVAEFAAVKEDASKLAATVGLHVNAATVMAQSVLDVAAGSLAQATHDTVEDAKADAQGARARVTQAQEVMASLDALLAKYPGAHAADHVASLHELVDAAVAHVQKAEAATHTIAAAVSDAEVLAAHKVAQAQAAEDAKAAQVVAQAKAAQLATGYVAPTGATTLKKDTKHWVNSGFHHAGRIAEAHTAAQEAHDAGDTKAVAKQFNKAKASEVPLQTAVANLNTIAAQYPTAVDVSTLVELEARLASCTGYLGEMQSWAAGGAGPGAVAPTAHAPVAVDGVVQSIKDAAASIHGWHAEAVVEASLDMLGGATSPATHELYKKMVGALATVDGGWSQLQAMAAAGALVGDATMAAASTAVHTAHAEVLDLAGWVGKLTPEQEAATSKAALKASAAKGGQPSMASPAKAKAKAKATAVDSGDATAAKEYSAAADAFHVHKGLLETRYNEAVAAASAGGTKAKLVAKLEFCFKAAKDELVAMGEAKGAMNSLVDKYDTHAAPAGQHKSYAALYVQAAGWVDAIDTMLATAKAAPAKGKVKVAVPGAPAAGATPEAVAATKAKEAEEYAAAVKQAEAAAKAAHANVKAEAQAQATVAHVVAPPVVHAPHPEMSAADIMHTKTGDAKGSNTGGFYKGKDGVLRYVKEYTDPTQSLVEHLSNSIYNDLGLAAPRSTTFELNGKRYYASVVEEGAKNLGLNAVGTVEAHGVLRGLAADVLTANWDAVGMTGDNVMVLANGSIMRVDNGGSLLFRAKAGRKDATLLTKATEWEGFFSSSKNPAYSQIAAKAGWTTWDSQAAQLSPQINAITALRDKHGGWAAYVERIAGALPAKDKADVVSMLEARTKDMQGRLAHLHAKVAEQAARVAKELEARAKAAADEARKKVLAEYAKTHRVQPRKLATTKPGAKYATRLADGVGPTPGMTAKALPEASEFPELAHFESKNKHYDGRTHTEHMAHAKAVRTWVDKHAPEVVPSVRAYANGEYQDIRRVETAMATEKPVSAHDRAYATHSNNINKLFGSKANEIESRGTMWRGFPCTNNQLNKLLDGTLSDSFGLGVDWVPSVTSCTYRRGTAHSFAGRSCRDDGSGVSHCIVQIHNPRAVTIEASGGLGDGEGESLLRRDARYRLLSAARDPKTGFILLEIEELP